MRMIAGKRRLRGNFYGDTRDAASKIIEGDKLDTAVPAPVDDTRDTSFVNDVDRIKYWNSVNAYHDANKIFPGGIVNPKDQPPEYEERQADENYSYGLD